MNWCKSDYMLFPADLRWIVQVTAHKKQNHKRLSDMFVCVCCFQMPFAVKARVFVHKTMPHDLVMDYGASCGLYCYTTLEQTRYTLAAGSPNSAVSMSGVAFT